MAEQEVIQHTKKIFKIFSNKNMNVWHKIREFLVEIFIIVFAITLSIWFHEYSEHKHQQKEAREFLLGVKADLTHDVQEMDLDVRSFIQNRKMLRYIKSVKFGEVLNNDSLQNNEFATFNITRFVANSGRFEGFKSSGKIATIENTALQNNILDLYQEYIPNLLTVTDIFNQRKERLHDYVNVHMKRIAAGKTNLNIVLSQDEAQNLCPHPSFIDEILANYTRCRKLSEAIISQIDEEIKE
jgi:hypothetical protein